MREQLSMIERVLALLPLDGQPVAFGMVMRQAHTTLHLSAGSAGAALAELCTEKRAAVETRGDYTFARRLPDLVRLRELAEYPLRARTPRPPPPLRRQAATTAPALKRGRKAA